MSKNAQYPGVEAAELTRRIHECVYLLCGGGSAQEANEAGKEVSDLVNALAELAEPRIEFSLSLAEVVAQNMVDAADNYGKGPGHERFERLRKAGEQILSLVHRGRTEGRSLLALTPIPSFYEEAPIDAQER